MARLIHYRLNYNPVPMILYTYTYTCKTAFTDVTAMKFVMPTRLIAVEKFMKALSGNRLFRDQIAKATARRDSL